jgi:hypothetical protein
MMTEPIDVQAAVRVLQPKLRRPSVSSLLVPRPRLLDQLNDAALERLGSETLGAAGQAILYPEP